MDIIRLLILIVILTVLNSFFVICKYSIVKINIDELDKIITDNKGKLDRCRQIKEKTDKVISVCQLGNVVALLIIGYATSEVLKIVYTMISENDLVVEGFILVVIAILIVVYELVFGFFIPRHIAMKNPQSTFIKNSFLLRISYMLLRPIAMIGDVIAESIANIFASNNAIEEEVKENTVAVSSDDSEAEKTEYEIKQEIMDNIFTFEERQIREILVPRTDMICIDLDDSEEHIFNLIKEEGYTRYPVCGESKDDLLGFIHIRDLYNQKVLEDKIDISKILREITYVSESELTSKVLEKLRKNRVQMAIVVDEYGGTSGIITVEDILEEIVGEIQDEFDEDEILGIEKLDENTYISQGTTTIMDLNRLLDIEIERDGFESLGGLVFYILGMKLKEGQSFIVQGHKFTLLELDKFRVVNVKIEKIPEVVD